MILQDTRRRILFVDDDTNTLDGLRRILHCKRDEWDLGFAESGECALAKIIDGDWDTVVTDIRMPNGDGLSLLRAIRSRAETFDLPVLILTGNSDADLKRKALDAGATDVLSKPIGFEDLLARLGSSLRLRSYQNQIKRANLELEERVAQRTQELRTSQRDIVWRLGRMAEFRDEETGGHVVRVGQSSNILAAAMGLDTTYCDALFLAAPLHDLGKVAVPDHILRKPGRLTDEERTEMQQHTVIGARILSNDPFGALLAPQTATEPSLDNAYRNDLLDMAAEIALSHHERWDGNGYPNRIAAETIPLSARIVAVADVYDALRSERPYKRAMSDLETVRIMRDECATHFDPAVWEAFGRCSAELRDVQSQAFDGPSSLRLAA